MREAGVQPHTKQRIRFVSKCVLLLLVVMILAGIAYEQIGERLDRKRFPQVGRSVDIGGRSLNIYCSGEGNPAVILDTGGSAPGYENLILQMRIAEFARTCWFDRAGLGWSDPSPIEQTSAAIADDLHALLHTAGVAPPYVLVGASFSGFNVRVFAGRYAAEVAGAILVDSAHEDQYRYEPRVTLAPVNRLPKPIRNLLCAGVPVAARIGLVRFLLQQSGPRRNVPPGFTVDEAATLHGLELQTKSFVAAAVCNFEEKSPEQARAAGNLGDRQLIVLTARQSLRVGDPEVDKELEAFHEMWVHQFQVQLARLSSRGRQVIVENSGHAIDSEAVLRAIHEVVMEIRGK
jgi:pimeloyl-ACP methyl ester carboxylesterase